MKKKKSENKKKGKEDWWSKKIFFEEENDENQIDFEDDPQQINHQNQKIIKKEKEEKNEENEEKENQNQIPNKKPKINIRYINPKFSFSIDSLGKYSRKHFAKFKNYIEREEKEIEEINDQFLESQSLFDCIKRYIQHVDNLEDIKINTKRAYLTNLKIVLNQIIENEEIKIDKKYLKLSTNLLNTSKFQNKKSDSETKVNKNNEMNENENEIKNKNENKNKNEQEIEKEDENKIKKINPIFNIIYFSSKFFLKCFSFFLKKVFFSLFKIIFFSFFFKIVLLFFSFYHLDYFLKNYNLINSVEFLFVSFHYFSSKSFRSVSHCN